ncbi:MAG TPA: ankyrin repeat domain-containing protein [Reyranella sp.]|jgi:ankyrin repeat protein|nr:ankyrin repeat domain-containing protein [Reyranella sp.]
MKRTGEKKDPFSALVEAIVRADVTTATAMLAASPDLARQRAVQGADRQQAEDSFFEEITHYMYEGDSALHMAAASYQKEIAADLIAKGADVRARNRRGAEPLHYASDGVPGSRRWDPSAQAATIAILIAAGADPNSLDKSGVAPLHRAVRTRCAAAVEALLQGGADVSARNKSGSTPLLLARQKTGRGGSGSAEARAQQEEILRLLQAHGAT